MEIVYFPEELNARAPDSFGVLYSAITREWIDLFNIADIVRAGEVLTIRPASEIEMHRAEKHVALYEIGMLLGAQLHSLLDEEPREDADKKIQAVHDAITSVDISMPPLVDCESATAAEAPSSTADEPAPDIPQLCDALRDAHVAGDIAGTWYLADQIATQLLDSLSAGPSTEGSRPSGE